MQHIGEQRKVMCLILNISFMLYFKKLQMMKKKVSELMGTD